MCDSEEDYRKKIASEFYTYCIFPEQQIFYASLFVYLKEEDYKKETTEYSTKIYLNYNRNYLDTLFYDYKENFRRLIVRKLIRLNLILEEFELIDSEDIKRCEGLRDMVGYNSRLTIDTWGVERKAILRAVLKIKLRKTDCIEASKHEYR